eukprot:5208803-Pyramimonas_sp.AAC.1
MSTRSGCCSPRHYHMIGSWHYHMIGSAKLCHVMFGHVSEMMVKCARGAGPSGERQWTWGSGGRGRQGWESR